MDETMGWVTRGLGTLMGSRELLVWRMIGSRVLVWRDLQCSMVLDGHADDRSNGNS